MPPFSKPAPTDCAFAQTDQPCVDANRALTIDDDSLMMFEDGLRAHLPGVDEIIERAAVRKRKARTAGAVAVLSLIVALFWLDPAYRSEQIATAVGERGRWTMHDGSEILLNTASTLRVEYHLRSRRLYLSQGEALFKVEHSRWRSFLVYAQQTRVEDIGTVFNVRNTDAGVQVMVLEGRVEVSTKQNPDRIRVLDTDQSVQVDDDQLGDTRHVDAALAAVWHDGKLHFDNTPLKDVVMELQRYRVAPVRLARSLSDLRITGQFDIDRIDQLLGMLPTLAPVSVRRDADGSVTIAPKSNSVAAFQP